MKLMKTCGIINPNVDSPLESELVKHAVYNDWKLVIQLFLHIESYIAQDLWIPSIHLVKLAKKVDSQQIVKMLLTLDTNLHLHALKYNEEILEILLENGLDVNSLDKNGYMPIHLAAQLDSIKNVQLLIRFGATVNVKGPSGWLELHLAIFKKRTKIVQFLIESGSDFNAFANGEMPIHIAANSGAFDCVKLLKNYGADVNARGLKGWRPIHFSVDKKFTEIVKYLLQNGAKVNSKTDEGSLPIHIAAQSGCIRIVELLIEHGANLHAKGSNGWLPLHYAAYFKHFEVAQFIINNGGNNHSTSDGGHMPIDFAIIYGSESIFKLFTNNGATVRQDSIHMAIKNHCAEMIKPLVEYGLDINERSGPFGDIAFHEAVKCGCNHCVHALKECIKFGANTNMKDDEGKTSLEHALSKGKYDIFKILSQI